MENVRKSEISDLLRPYQWKGVHFLVRQNSCLLADEMGLGKTVQVTVALSLLVPKSKYGRVLIVVPAALRINWEKEIEKWAAGRDELYSELMADPESLVASGIKTVRRIGDCFGPATIAAAIYEGHRYAREMDSEIDPDGVPFKLVSYELDLEK